MFKTIWALRIVLLCTAFVLASGCGSSSPDQSLALDEYVMAGIPACDKPWSATEMAAVANVLTKIAKTNPKQLPQYRSQKSGVLFARLTSPENLDPFNDKTKPIGIRFGEAGDFLQAGNQLLKLYNEAFMQKSPKGSEVIEIIGMNLRVSVAMFELLREFTPTLDKNDASYFNRMAGIERIRQGLTSMIASGFQTVSERRYYQPEDLTRLLGYMQQSFPIILAEVQKERHNDLFAQLDNLIKDASFADLRPGLEKLKELMTAAVEWEERNPREHPGIKLEDLEKRGVTMHRLQTGTLDSNGWCVAESALGGFSVELPGKFNDFTQIGKATDGEPIEINGLAMVTLQGVKYTAILLTRADGHYPYKGDVFDEIGKTFDKEKGNRVSKQKVSIAGNSGIEIRVSSKSSEARFRGFLAKRGIFQMVVEYSAWLPNETVAADVTRFFESFRLIKKEQKD